jgi:hypothetical protein
MEKNNQTKERKNLYTGLGIALGAGFGSTLGLLLMDGNIASGAGIGIAVGLVVGSIADTLGGKPLYTLVGIALGAGIGSIFGLLLDKLLLAHGYMELGAGLGTAFGLVIGAVVDTRKERRKS